VAAKCRATAVPLGSHCEPAGAVGPGVEYSSLIEKLRLPPGFLPPARLTYEDLLARAITRADLHDDVRGINASIALIQTTTTTSMSVGE
jgi:hypothetical protein